MISILIIALAIIATKLFNVFGYVHCIHLISMLTFGLQRKTQ